MCFPLLVRVWRAFDCWLPPVLCRGGARSLLKTVCLYKPLHRSSLAPAGTGLGRVRTGGGVRAGNHVL